MPLPNWDWPNPLDTLLEGLSKVVPEKDMEEFQGAELRYNVKYRHLQQIWARLSIAAAGFDGQSAVMMLMAAPGRDPNSPLSDEENKVIQAAQAATAGFSLDYDDFFIHSKILLDRAIFLSRYLLSGLRGKDMTSFTRHRAFFLRTIPYDPDEEYASHIRRKTAWYETTLRHYRDEFVTHDAHLTGFGTMFGPGGGPRAIRRPAKHAKQETWNAQYSRLLGLRDKYLEAIPKLKDTHPNAHELLNVFDSYSEVLSIEDLGALNPLHLFMGAKMPDVIEVMNSMLEFLRFFGEHFSRRLGSM